MPTVVLGSGAQQPATLPCEPRSGEREEEEGEPAVEGHVPATSLGEIAPPLRDPSLGHRS